MIPISPGQFFSIYVCLWLIVLAFLWFREERRVQKSNWSVVKDKLYVCDKCHLSFLAQDNREYITRCPRCNEMCFIKKRKQF